MEHGREPGIDLLDQAGGDVGGSGEDHVVRHDGGPAAQDDFVPIAAGNDRKNAAKVAQ